MRIRTLLVTTISAAATTLFGAAAIWSQSVANAPARPSYAEMEKHFSKDKHDCPDIATSPNQCAVRVSRSLIGAGIKMDNDYPGKLCKHGYARGAQDLGAFLKVKWGNPNQTFAKPGKNSRFPEGQEGRRDVRRHPGF